MFGIHMLTIILKWIFLKDKTIEHLLSQGKCVLNYTKQRHQKTIKDCVKVSFQYALKKVFVKEKQVINATIYNHSKTRKQYYLT